MYDDLRSLQDPSQFDEGDYEDYEEELPERPIFGLSAIQRLILSVLLLGAVTMMGLMCLLVFERVWLFG